MDAIATQRYKEYFRAYKDLHLWVFPDYPTIDTNMFYWAYWRNKKQDDYNNMFADFNWNEATGIYIVVGKKGIRGIVLKNLGYRSSLYRNNLIGKALSFLNLPEDYPWVIDAPDSSVIFVDTKHDPIGQPNQGLKNITLLWEGSYPLPSITGELKFHFDSMPTYRPIQIEAKDFLSIVRLLNDDIVLKEIEKETIKGGNEYKKKTITLKREKEEKITRETNNFLRTHYLSKIEDSTFGKLLIGLATLASVLNIVLVALDKISVTDTITYIVSSWAIVGLFYFLGWSWYGLKYLREVEHHKSMLYFAVGYIIPLIAVIAGWNSWMFPNTKLFVEKLGTLAVILIFYFSALIGLYMLFKQIVTPLRKVYNQITELLNNKKEEEC